MHNYTNNMMIKDIVGYHILIWINEYRKIMLIGF